MTGTQNFEGIAGTKSAIDYLVDLGRQIDPSSAALRDSLRTAYAAIGNYERYLVSALLKGLEAIPEINILGLTDRNRLNERTPTVSFTHNRLSAIEIADRLGQLGLFVGHGNFYALQVTEAFGLEPQGVVRVGLMHYNTLSEVERLLAALRSY